MTKAVVIVVDRNEADTEKRKNMLQIVAHFNVVTTKTGKVFDYDTSDFTELGKLNHSLKIWTGEVRAGETVVTELQTRKIT